MAQVSLILVVAVALIHTKTSLAQNPQVQSCLNLMARGTSQLQGCTVVKDDIGSCTPVCANATSGSGVLCGYLRAMCPEQTSKPASTVTVTTTVKPMGTPGTIMSAKTITVTVQGSKLLPTPSPKCCNESPTQTLTTPTSPPSSNTHVPTALGVMMAILLVALIGVIGAWTCCTMKGRLLKKFSSPAATIRLERYTTDKSHQRPNTVFTCSSNEAVPPHTLDAATPSTGFEDYATVSESLAAINPRYMSRGLANHCRQGERESTHILVENDYHIQEASRKSVCDLEQNYQVLEQLNASENEDRKEDKEVEATAAAAVYEIPVASKNRSSKTVSL